MFLMGYQYDCCGYSHPFYSSTDSVRKAGFVMINLTLGQPGGGKSYEAVAFHIIPAIEQGRKVITNLALKIDVFDQYFPKLL